jgi:hypothetical protein
MEMLDLFSNYQHITEFSWILAIFRDRGATEAIKRACDIPLKFYYPLKFNIKGEPVPMWRPYLFLEYRDSITLDICRNTKKFIDVYSMKDDEGNKHPVMVRNSSINEHRDLLITGKFNEHIRKRRFYGKGSLVSVIDGGFIGKRVRLESDISSDMVNGQRVPININGMRASIEIWKLNLC